MAAGSAYAAAVLPLPQYRSSAARWNGTDENENTVSVCVWAVLKQKY
jgi:hypothetical protein